MTPILTLLSHIPQQIKHLPGIADLVQVHEETSQNAMRVEEETLVNSCLCNLAYLDAGRDLRDEVALLKAIHDYFKLLNEPV